jgi:hypothetical protein
MPSYTFECQREECKFRDFEVRAYDPEKVSGKPCDTPCEKCGGPTMYCIPTGAGGEGGFGCIRIEDSKMWSDADNPGSLVKLKRVREIQNGRQSEVGRILPERLHIDNIRRRMKEGKIKPGD